MGVGVGVGFFVFVGLGLGLGFGDLQYRLLGFGRLLGDGLPPGPCDDDGIGLGEGPGALLTGVGVVSGGATDLVS